MITVTGAWGYNQYRPDPHVLDGEVVDCTTASWIVSNCYTDNPTVDCECSNPACGNNPINTYPVNIDHQDNCIVQNGTIFSDVNLQSDWKYSYMNSAAILLYRSESSTIKHWRVTACWDCCRAAVTQLGVGDNFTFEEIYATGIRDDCVENDNKLNGTIKNCLFDGAFVGISADSQESEVYTGAGKRMVVDNVLIRLTPYWWTDKFGTTRYTHMQPLKPNGTSGDFIEDFVLKNSIFVWEVESSDQNRWTKAIVSLNDAESSNNTLIWANDDAVPQFITDSLSHPSFSLISGKAAGEAAWEAAASDFKQTYGFSDDMDTSNLLTDQFNTLAILHTPRTDTVTPTGAKVYITSNLDTDTTYWAVFSEPSAKLPADIITPTGAADSGNAPAQLTEDEFTATGLDTENQRYWVWYAHSDSTMAVSGVAFGGPAGGGGKGSLALNLTLVI